MIFLDIIYQKLIEHNKKDFINIFSRSINYLNKKEKEEEEYYKPSYELNYDESYSKIKNLAKRDELIKKEIKDFSLLNNNHKDSI